MIKQKAEEAPETVDSQMLGVRINGRLTKRIGDMVCKLRARHPEIPWNKSSAVRYLIHRGLESEGE